MKELKAYIRRWKLEETVNALQDAGAPGITVVDVHPVGYGFEPNYFSQASDITRRMPEIVKIELVCHDEQVEEFMSVIRKHTSTGEKGDGRIFIYPVEDALRIRDHSRGADALRSFVTRFEHALKETCFFGVDYRFIFHIARYRIASS